MLMLKTAPCRYAALFGDAVQEADRHEAHREIAAAV
jgi:hypothetical protein